MAIRNKIQLITYPNSLGGNLKTLDKVLSKYFPDIFQGGIHILPPFLSSGDRGFAPVNYFKIDKQYGTWKNIHKLASKFDILLDLMVNHISRKSVYFRDFLKKGKDSKYADLFLNIEKIWTDGNPVAEDISKMFLRRPIPYSSFLIKKGTKELKVWTTFGKQEPSEQIDFDINSETTKNLLFSFLRNFKNHKIKIVRLDAIAYVIKKRGTSCFFVEPEIYDFFEWIYAKAKELELELLPEVHAHYAIQFNLAKKGYWIYDFILPYLILETFINKSGKKLKEYIKIRPRNQFTMLDCHDGIAVKPDLDGFVNSVDARKVVKISLQRGANLSFVYSNKFKDIDGFDVHQIRGTYYSLLNSDDDAYIAARAIQFFVPGIPQVYYVGLLAGENDYENAIQTGDGREINRHNFDLWEIKKAIDKPVVQRLLKLIRFRNTYPAFNGEFFIEQTGELEIVLIWQNTDSRCVLNVDLTTNNSTIEYIDTKGALIIYKV